jgi:phosphoserine phosphatase
VGSNLSWSLSVSEVHPLIEVATHVETHAASSKVAVIFDLDSTLFSVSPRTQFILRELSKNEDFRTRYAKEAEILGAIEILPTDWGLREALQRHPVSQSIEFFKEVRNHWRKHFFSNHALINDEIYPHANEYVQHLQELGAAIKYLTGRGEDQMKVGTIEALHRFGFPLEDEGDLIMKPTEAMTDESYKVTVLRDLARDFDYIWFFENEPLIIADVRRELPQVQIVFMDSTHARRAEPPRDLRTIGMSYSQGLPSARLKK